MPPAVALAVYCLLIIVASLAGGLVPVMLRVTHRRMQLALSLVSGVMLGIAILHLLPDAITALDADVPASAHDHAHDHEHQHVGLQACAWLLGGFLAMFFIERWFCYHHHDAPGGDSGAAPSCDHAGHAHGHELTWGPAAVGLSLHTLIAGAALAAAVRAHADDGTALPGLAMFLAIVLHKPFDALTVGTLMAAGGRSTLSRHLVNALFSLALPVGVIAFELGLAGSAEPTALVGAALAFAAGAFLCIALSDLLPELQFHQHDRVGLSLALLAGIAVAAAVTLAGG